MADKHNWDLWQANANLGKMSRFWLILSTAYLKIIEKELDCSVYDGGREILQDSAS